MRLQLQTVCLGAAQLLLGRDVCGSRGRLLPQPPPVPRGCWFSRSAVAELLGNRDVIAGPAGKPWETEPLINRAWGSVEGQPVACLPSLPPCQASTPPPPAPAPGGLQPGAWASPGSGSQHQTVGIPMDLPSMQTSFAWGSSFCAAPERCERGILGKGPSRVS